MCLQRITNEQIKCAINRLKPYKVVMARDIANIALKEAKDLVVPFLGPIYRTTFALQAYPKSWKWYDTVVLRKPG